MRSYVRGCVRCGSNHWIEHEEDKFREHHGNRYIVRYDCPLTGHRSSFWRIPYKTKLPEYGNWL